jgi:hypothetical protein
MEAAIAFGPIHVQGNGVGEADVEHSARATVSLALLASRGCRPRCRRN